MNASLPSVSFSCHSLIPLYASSARVIVLPLRFFRSRKLEILWTRSNCIIFLLFVYSFFSLAPSLWLWLFLKINKERSSGGKFVASQHHIKNKNAIISESLHIQLRLKQPNCWIFSPRKRPPFSRRIHIRRTCWNISGFIISDLSPLFVHILLLLYTLGIDYAHKITLLCHNIYFTPHTNIVHPYNVSDASVIAFIAQIIIFGKLLLSRNLISTNFPWFTCETCMDVHATLCYNMKFTLDFAELYIMTRYKSIISRNSTRYDIKRHFMYLNLNGKAAKIAFSLFESIELGNPFLCCWIANFTSFGLIAIWILCTHPFT